MDTKTLVYNIAVEIRGYGEYPNYTISGYAEINPAKLHVFIRNVLKAKCVCVKRIVLAEDQRLSYPIQFNNTLNAAIARDAMYNK